MMFNNIYKNKKVLITGNTGFKGSWLSLWLLALGADLYGVSKDIPTVPSNFEASKLEDKIKHYQQDIRNSEKVLRIIEEVQPDFLFHLAAQPIVKESYISPLETIETNTLGTANILEALRKLNNPCVAVIITSDKCYDNLEWIWGYRETDTLGGSDPYSASKGAAELIVKTYSNSFFKGPSSKVRIASARAGNVIGGGDWAKYRIVPDAVRAWVEKKALMIRSPFATRPWQHVLEPLSGYLLLGQKLYGNSILNGEAFNFGPNSNQNFTVEELLNEMAGYWPGAKWKIEKTNNEIKEAGLLKLNCDKALHHLKWQPTLNYKQTVKFVAAWYNEYYHNKNSNMFEFTSMQIEEYSNIGLNLNQAWAQL